MGYVDRFSTAPGIFARRAASPTVRSCPAW